MCINQNLSQKIRMHNNLWDFVVETDPVISARSHLMMITMNKRSCHVVDFVTVIPIVVSALGTVP